MWIILTASLLPVVVLLLYIYAKDKYRKEPFSMLMKAFFGGILSALMVLVLSQLIPDNPYSYEPQSSIYQAFCQAALPEEFCKLFFLYLFIWRNKHFDEYFDGIVYAVFVGLGFAGLENLLYVVQFGLDVAIGRAIFAVPAHFIFAVVMGYYFALARFKRKKKGYYKCLCYIVPVLLHGCYDAILMYTDAIQKTDVTQAAFLNIGFFIFFIFIWKRAKRKISILENK